MGKRQGGRPRTPGAALFPVSSEAEGFLEDLVHAVPARPRPNAAEGIGPPCRGMNLSRLRQDGPPHVGDQREEGVDRIGHFSPRCLRPRVGGWLAGGIVVPYPAPLVHPHGVGPAGGRLSLEEGEAAARTKEPVGRGVVPLLHASRPGLPPQRHARLLPPHGRQVPAPRVREAAAAGVRPGGVRVEDLGVPPLQGLAHSGPLGPELGAAGALNGGDPDPFVLGPVTAVPPPVPGSHQEVLEAQDPGEQSHQGGQGTDGVGLGPLLGAGRKHQGGLAVPPANQGEAMAPPLVLGEGGWGGRGHVPASPSLASSPSTSSWSTRHVRKRLAAGRKGGQGWPPMGWGWGGGEGDPEPPRPPPPTLPGQAAHVSRRLPGPLRGGGVGRGGTSGRRPSHIRRTPCAPCRTATPPPQRDPPPPT